MNISTSAWHYKVFSFAYDCFKSKYNRPHINTMSLCPYFWWVVAGIAFIAFIVAAASWIIVMFVPAIPVLLLVLFGFISPPSDDSYLMGWVVMGFIEVVFLAIIGTWYGAKKLFKWIRSKRQHAVKVDKPDSLLVSYVKAKKSKFCPTVTFTKQS